MINPLIKRIPKELKSEWRKYVVIAVVMVFMIGLTSGVYVGNNSMMTELDGAYEKYKREDGHFELNKEASSDLIKALEKGEIADIRAYLLDEAGLSEDAPAEYLDAIDEKYNEIAEKLSLDEENTNYSANIYELFYKDTDEDDDMDGSIDGDIRVYKMRTDIDLICLMEGSFPQKDGEILIDRMHADNVGLSVGDKIEVSGMEFTITGLGAFSDYATLHKKNNDIMFDAITFDVAVVTDNDYEQILERNHYNYAWRYDTAPSTDSMAKDMSDAFKKVLSSWVIAGDFEIESYVPAYLSQSINFAPDDMGSDLAMMKVLMYVLIAVLAFIFALTTDSSIEKEASVIGTLRASGYTRGEILRHYMAMPLIVTLISAIIGNILGYTIFEDICVWAYYNSYSLPTYETLFTPNAFALTTILPIIMMFIINIFIISRKLRLSPLKFLRHDLKKRKRAKAMRLPQWSFLKRFRLRIFFQNIPNYLVLIFGLVFIGVLLSMCIGMPETLRSYQKNAADMMFTDYQTFLLKTTDDDGEKITTSVTDAEKFASTELEYTTPSYEEGITIYGVEKDSSYVDISDITADGIYVSSAFSEKYSLDIGDSILLTDKYTDAKYTFDIDGIFEYEGALSVFMTIDNFRDIFDKDSDYFSGYFSSEEITDIDSKYIATVVTVDDILAVAKQLDHSMGDIMDIFSYVCAIIAAAFIYLLTKVIIEKNENAISMIKILGFTDKEIASLYIVTTTIVVIVGDIIAVILGNEIMSLLWKSMLSTMSGYFRFITTTEGNIKMFVLIFVAYLLITIIDYRRIKNIPKTNALKNVE